MYLNGSFGQIGTAPADTILGAVEIAVRKLMRSDCVLVQLNVVEHSCRRLRKDCAASCCREIVKKIAVSCVPLCRYH